MIEKHTETDGENTGQAKREMNMATRKKLAINTLNRSQSQHLCWLYAEHIAARATSTAKKSFNIGLHPKSNRELAMWLNKVKQIMNECVPSFRQQLFNSSRCCIKCVFIAVSLLLIFFSLVLCVLFKPFLLVVYTFFLYVWIGIKLKQRDRCAKVRFKCNIRCEYCAKELDRCIDNLSLSTDRVAKKKRQLITSKDIAHIVAKS